MRKISGIKYTATLIILAILIAALSCPLVYSATAASRSFTISSPQVKETLVKYNKAEEGRMIREKKLYEFYVIKVTTRNQKKFDGDKDGYLSGKELKKYLAEYYR